MDRKLKLSPELSLPVDAVTQRLAFIGRTGTGKTYAAMKLAELMLDAGQQIIALDPVGVWYGLRVPGRGKGYSIPVFGGLHGDVPLEPNAGALIADLVVDRRLSCVIDVSQFEHDTDKARFAAAFAARFFFRKKATRGAVHLFIEEAQEFFPQETQRGEQQMVHDFVRMAKIGRNFGIGISIITQRPQEVNKKALNLTECLFAFQMTGTHERKAMKAWAQTQALDEDLYDLLPTLPNGRAHVYSPQWLRVSLETRVHEKRTADVSSTPTIDAGEAAAAARPLTPVDLDALKEKMVATIERAKADDPKLLRGEIASLRSQLTKAQKAAPIAAAPIQKGVPERVVEARVRRATEGYERILKQAQADVAGFVKEADRIAQRWIGVGEEVKLQGELMAQSVARFQARVKFGPPDAATAFADAATAALAGDRTAARALPDLGRDFLNTARHAPSRLAPESIENGDRMSGVGRRILDTLHGLETLGVAQPDKITVGALVGYKNMRSKSVANALGALRSAGLIEYIGTERMELTAEGRARSKSSLAVSSRDELHRVWFARLGGVPERILRPLIAVYPNGLSIDAVASEAGYENPRSKSFANAKGRLRTLGLIEQRGNALLATDILFPEALP